ncbi:polysaccharide deacetylase family protein [Microbacterium pseudoresistens]
MRGIDRRTALLGLLAVGITGCAAAPRGPQSSTPGPSEALHHTPHPTAHAAPLPPPPHYVPDPDAVAERFIGAVPTAWGMDLPGITTQLAASTDASLGPRIALTFDACGGRGGSDIDHKLIDGLRATRTPATLFLNARWIEANAALAAELAADPLFLLGNHGTRHVPLSVIGASAYGIPGTASVAEAVAEVWGNHVVLTELVGTPPTLFRAGTAHYDDVAVQIVHDLGETPVGFSVNGDGGATYSADVVRSEFGRVADRGIILAHMNQPQGSTAEGALPAVASLRVHGFHFMHVVEPVSEA